MTAKTQLDYLRDDLYGILGVAPDASPAEIKQAYFSKALSCHPNSFQFVINQTSSSLMQTNDEFVAVAVAYEVLKDAKLRRLYDAQYEPPRKHKRARTIVGAVLVFMWVVLLRQLLRSTWLFWLLLPVLPLLLLSLAVYLDTKKPKSWEGNDLLQQSENNRLMPTPTTTAAGPTTEESHRHHQQEENDDGDDQNTNDTEAPLSLAGLDAMLDSFLPTTTTTEPTTPQLPILNNDDHQWSQSISTTTDANNKKKNGNDSHKGWSIPVQHRVAEETETTVASHQKNQIRDDDNDEVATRMQLSCSSIGIASAHNNNNGDTGGPCNMSDASVGARRRPPPAVIPTTTSAYVSHHHHHHRSSSGSVGVGSCLRRRSSSGVACRKRGPAQQQQQQQQQQVTTTTRSKNDVLRTTGNGNGNGDGDGDGDGDGVVEVEGISLASYDRPGSYCYGTTPRKLHADSAPLLTADGNKKGRQAPLVPSYHHHPSSPTASPPRHASLASSGNAATTNSGQCHVPLSD
eukprot:TRINITY_DN67365_c9_g1_i2.p1 TRINITY_DN67365_c9_g1~~TRINITY_DN67365_c9_g1_i2.p1  ORF type:complete len:515 (+),score=99.40 TRINITY_DN67365_c9_g1_i2:54-1598(+)